MKSQFVEKEFAYDGTQLRSLFGYLDHRIMGDSIVSWVGSCDISFEHMVDGEDLLEESLIAGGRMVHFIIEKFHTSLIAGVALQRLFASICQDILREKARISMPQPEVTTLRREGDDIFYADGKMSISIATLSPVSCLIHFAINCSNKGTPVKTASLQDLGINEAVFARLAMERFVAEIHSIEEATTKVKWVR